MNKHTVSEETLDEFLRSFRVLRDCLAAVGEIVVKAKFHIGCYRYKAKVWSEKKKEGGTK